MDSKVLPNVRTDLTATPTVLHHLPYSHLVHIRASKRSNNFRETAISSESMSSTNGGAMFTPNPSTGHPPYLRSSETVDRVDSAESTSRLVPSRTVSPPALATKRKNTNDRRLTLVDHLSKRLPCLLIPSHNPRTCSLRSFICLHSRRCLKVYSKHRDLSEPCLPFWDSSEI
jgi:hypothetical protein